MISGARTRSTSTNSIAAMLLCAALLVTSCAPRDASERAALEPIRVSWSRFESCTPFWIAQERGLLESHGLRVVSHEYESGAASLQAVIDGKADMAVGVTEFPLVSAGLKGEKVQTAACISRSEFIYVVARRDRHIDEPSDLRGKRIGTTFGTIAHFYLGRFLEVHGLSPRDVTIVDLKTPREWVDAVATGKVDAVATAQPYASQARSKLGSNGLWWPAQLEQPLYAQAVGRADWLREHPEETQAFLGALSDADDYIASDPRGAETIVTRRLRISRAQMAQVWRENDFSLSLDESLLLAMEDEARWLIANGLTSATVLPDVSELVYSDALRKVQPEAVGVER